MAAAVRNRNISAAELTTLRFRQIDRHDPKLAAIVWQPRDQAVARATEADKALAPTIRGISLERRADRQEAAPRR
jgi:Asp-tRNA(Asn)/Glu-tRNA(Gln) amidotransferase A subunit family amidase